MIAKIFSSRGSLRSLHFAAKRSFATKSNDHYAISQLLQQVEKGSISANEAEKAMRDLAELNAKGKAPDETLRSFANLDHRRSSRTGFPEVCVCGYFEEKCCTFIVSHPSNCMFQIDRYRPYLQQGKLRLKSLQFWMIWQVMSMNLFEVDLMLKPTTRRFLQQGEHTMTIILEKSDSLHRILTF
jgi:hypothetical protein